MDSIDPNDNFWSRGDIGDENKCWEWEDACDPQLGYGRYWNPKTKSKIRSHVYAYEDAHGELGNKEVRHHCDNRACCNPAHLGAGSRQDNMQDKCKRGRHNSVGTSVFEDHHIIEMRELYWNKGFSQNALADAFGVSQANVSQIVRGKRHPDHPMPDTESRPDTIPSNDPRTDELPSYAEEIESRKAEYTKDNLEPEDVVRIRWVYWTVGTTTEELAEEYGMSATHIQKIVTGKKWQFVNGPTTYDEAFTSVIPSSIAI
jgi:transcriptional regulator with XRE-family HTH domain